MVRTLERRPDGPRGDYQPLNRREFNAQGLNFHVLPAGFQRIRYIRGTGSVSATYSEAGLQRKPSVQWPAWTSGNAAL